MPVGYAATQTQGGRVYGCSTRRHRVERSMRLGLHPRTWAEQPMGQAISPSSRMGSLVRWSGYFVLFVAFVWLASVANLEPERRVFGLAVALVPVVVGAALIFAGGKLDKREPPSYSVHIMMVNGQVAALDESRERIDAIIAAVKTALGR